jgi:predicted secreted protein
MKTSLEKQPYNHEQQKIYDSVSQILGIVEKAQEVSGERSDDWKKALQKLLYDLQEAQSHIDNGLSVLPPGLTVDKLRIRADELVSTLK